MPDGRPKHLKSPLRTCQTEAVIGGISSVRLFADDRTKGVLVAPAARTANAGQERRQRRTGMPLLSLSLCS